MKLFIIKFKGLWLGGTTIIRAVDIQDAITISNEYLSEKYASKKYLPKEYSKIIQITEIPQDQAIIYFDDGDY